MNIGDERVSVDGQEGKTPDSMFLGHVLCAYIYIHMGAYMCVHIYICIYMCTYTCIHMCAYMYA